MTAMIEAEALRKRYGTTQALDGVSFSAPTGAILGVLGPNGAGKSTSVKILTTFADADSGRASVGGHDVRRDRHAVRSIIGVTAQDTTLDGLLTGRQNLEMMGELSGLSRAAARRRSVELLERVELTDAGDRMVKGYSGGMRRRLDLAASIVNRPPVLFLDEPTTGLDPTSRLRMWDLLRELVRDGLTLLLTTQYLDEADQLADTIVVIDHGRVIAEGTPVDLKRATGGLSLRLHLTDGVDVARRVLERFASGPVELTGGGVLHAQVDAEPGLATHVVRALDDAGVVVDDVELHRPSLDDVFFALTGERAESTTADTGAEAGADADGQRVPEEVAG